MIERRADRLCVTAPMVMSNASGLLEAGRSALKEKHELIDLGAVSEADSAALAIMLGWLRTARMRDSTLAFANVPTGLRSLAELYGVAELLPLA